MEELTVMSKFYTINSCVLIVYITVSLKFIFVFLLYSLLCYFVVVAVLLILQRIMIINYSCVLIFLLLIYFSKSRLPSINTTVLLFLILTFHHFF